MNNLTSNDSECFLPTEEKDDLDFLEKMNVIQWVAYRIIGPGVVGIGLIGNLLNLIVLTRPSLKEVTYSYLIGLACSDIGVLLCAVPMMFRQSRFDKENSWAVTFFYSHVEYPLANFFMASSIFIVLCLTLDRFASVCLPSRFKSLHIKAISQQAIMICFFVALLISIPLSFMNRICPVTFPNDLERPFTFVENYDVTRVSVWRIYIYAGEILVRFGPALMLAILNFFIIWRFRLITQKRREMLQGGLDVEVIDTSIIRSEKMSRIYKEEKRLITLLSAIVLLFFFTNTPVAILSISFTDTLEKNLYYQIFRAVANDLELCNFSLNFYIYFLCSKEFRKKFLSFFAILLPTKAANNFQSIPLQDVVLPIPPHNIQMGVQDVSN